MSSPFVFTKPNSLVYVQLRFSERDTHGKLKTKASKNLTIYNITLEEAYQRILEALQK